MLNRILILSMLKCIFNKGVDNHCWALLQDFHFHSNISDWWISLKGLWVVRFLISYSAITPPKFVQMNKHRSIYHGLTTLEVLMGRRLLLSVPYCCTLLWIRQESNHWPASRFLGECFMCAQGSVYRDKNKKRTASESVYTACIVNTTAGLWISECPFIGWVLVDSALVLK